MRLLPKYWGDTNVVAKRLRVTGVKFTLPDSFYVCKLRSIFLPSNYVSPQINAERSPLYYSRDRKLAARK